MVGHSPGSSLKNSCDFSFCLGEGLWNNAAFPELLIHVSNVPDESNIVIQPFPNDLYPAILINMMPKYLQLVISNLFMIALSKALSS